MNSLKNDRIHHMERYFQSEIANLIIYFKSEVQLLGEDMH